MTITISDASTPNAVFIGSDSDFFNDSVIIKHVENEKIVFTKPTLGFFGKEYSKKPYYTDRIHYTPNYPIPRGTFKAEEDETNEDVATFYFDSVA